ncbi:MAG: tRNA pseudouridine(13) synthase TruD [Candidatus Micrarchaeaceae archaeon]
MLRLSKGARASGSIKERAEDFRVEEITSSGHVLHIDETYSPGSIGFDDISNGKFSVFVMQKTNWNTAQALKAVARKFRRGVKSTAFAGTKDRMSVSTQLCSIFGAEPKDLSNIHIKDIKINGSWRGGEKIKVGDLLGNRFGISVRNASGAERIAGIISELDGLFPNYFGEQRFGYRGTNVDVGIYILKGDFREAALAFLTGTSGETNDDSRLARERLANEMDFKKAMEYFPMHLKYERSMLEYLSRFPNNYANAIRKLPRSISLMFVHSVESYIFNKELEQRIADRGITPANGDIICHTNSYGFPDMKNVAPFDGSKPDNAFIVSNILGYDTKSVTEKEQGAMDELGITTESFRVNGLNELNSKGTYRVMFAPFRGLSHRHDETGNGFELQFELPAGSYATVFLEELLEIPM